MRIEEMIAVCASAQRALRALLDIARWGEWQAPDVSVALRGAGWTLGPADRFRLEVMGGLAFDYLVEVVSDRDVVFSFDGAWRGRERWSFVPDGAEVVVRRSYEVEEESAIAAVAWRTLGWAVTSAHLKFELARFRSVVERAPGARGEIEPGSAPRAVPGDAPPPPSFPVDDG